MDVRVSRSRGGRGLCRITSRIVGDQDGRPLPATSLASPFLETVVNVSRLWAIVLFCIFADVFLSGF